MRATIIASDNSVLVDGVHREVDTSALAADGTHAVQWYDTAGEVEYVTTVIDVEIIDEDGNPTGEVRKQGHREPNKYITDLSPYQSYIDAWRVENAKQMLIEEKTEREIAEHQANAKAALAKAQEGAKS